LMVAQPLRFSIGWPTFTLFVKGETRAACVTILISADWRGRGANHLLTLGQQQENL
jgi:hypothetical protein